MRVYPPMKLKVFVDGITAVMEGLNEELAGFAEKSPTGDEKDLQLPITAGGK